METKKQKFVITYDGKQLTVLAQDCNSAIETARKRKYFGKKIIPQSDFKILCYDADTKGNKWAIYLLHAEDGKNRYVRVNIQ